MIRKRVVSVYLVVCITFVTIAQCFVPVVVFALSLGGLQTTIASVILSLMLECGVAPVNNAWLQTLNTSYGVTSSIGTIQDCIESGLLTQTATGLVDSGLSAAIESAPAYTDLGLSEIFTTTADDVALGVVAGSGGFNIATTAINVGTLGTIGAFAGAAAVGVGLGVLINHLREKFTQNIGTGIPIDKTNFISNLPNNALWYMNTQDGREVIHVLDVGNNKVVDSKVQDSTGYRFGTYPTNGNFYADNMTYFVDNGFHYKEGTVYVRGWGYSTVGLSQYIDSNYRSFPTDQDFRNFALAVESGDIDYMRDVYSPDLIGTEGNQRLGENENPDIKNVIPEGYDFKPVDLEDYMNYADTANYNTDEGNTNQPVQGEEFDNLIDSLLVEPSVIPDQGVTDPEVPDRPIIPDQPDTPAKDPITGEEQSEVLQGITTPDLRSVFPFCIPFDLYNIFGVFKSEGREAPIIVWEFEIFDKSYSVIIDLSPYEDVAALLRLLELIAFIVGLAVATRKLIGAGG